MLIVAGTVWYAVPPCLVFWVGGPRCSACAALPLGSSHRLICPTYTTCKNVGIRSTSTVSGKKSQLLNILFWSHCIPPLFQIFQWFCLWSIPIDRNGSTSVIIWPFPAFQGKLTVWQAGGSSCCYTWFGWDSSCPCYTKREKIKVI